jgi:hypothetical protein
MGVLVNGVPLFPTVGLAQPHLMPKRVVKEGASSSSSAALDCSSKSGASGVCGMYERIDPEQIVFSFKMPNGYAGNPTITLISPGRSVDLNSLPNLRINRMPNVGLKDERVPFMFGNRATLSITNLQLLSVSLQRERLRLR